MLLATISEKLILSMNMSKILTKSTSKENNSSQNAKRVKKAEDNNGLLTRLKLMHIEKKLKRRSFLNRTKEKNRKNRATA